MVLEYVKKQSVLKARHREKKQFATTAIEHDDDEELPQALKLSIQSYEARVCGQ